MGFNDPQIDSGFTSLGEWGEKNLKLRIVCPTC